MQYVLGEVAPLSIRVCHRADTLSVAMLSVIMLNVVILSVVGTCGTLFDV